MGKSDYPTANSSCSCLEPWQGPWRAVEPEPHCPPALGNREQPSREAALGGQKVGPPAWAELWPGVTHITEQTSTWGSHAPGKGGRGNMVPCSKQSPTSAASLPPRWPPHTDHRSSQSLPVLSTAPALAPGPSQGLLLAKKEITKSFFILYISGWRKAVRGEAPLWVGGTSLCLNSLTWNQQETSHPPAFCFTRSTQTCPESGGAESHHSPSGAGAAGAPLP